MLAAVTEYHPGVPLVIGADFGHTGPQYVIPSGGTVTVDGETRQILVTYCARGEWSEVVPVWDSGKDLPETRRRTAWRAPFR